jgi:hypothetical protein
MWVLFTSACWTYTQSLSTNRTIHPLWFNDIIRQATKCYIEFFESRGDKFYGTSFPFTICLCSIDQAPNRHIYILPLVLLPVNSSTAITSVPNNKSKHTRMYWLYWIQRSPPNDSFTKHALNESTPPPPLQSSLLALLASLTRTNQCFLLGFTFYDNASSKFSRLTENQYSKLRESDTKAVSRNYNVVWYINITITILGIIHRPVFYLKFYSTLLVCPYLPGNTFGPRYEPNRLMLSI